MHQVIFNKCRVWKLDLQVERSEIPIYRSGLATRVRIAKVTAQNPNEIIGRAFRSSMNQCTNELKSCATDTCVPRRIGDANGDGVFTGW